MSGAAGASKPTAPRSAIPPSPGRRTAFDWRRPEPLVLPPILAGARHAFHELGYHGATVRDIAQRVGVTVPALYYHYENKQAMLVTLLETGMAQVLHRVDRALSNAGE